MGKPFVSVLIDTYNHERFIEQAIVSVLEQDFPASEREIIVVDDGSTDRTPEIVRKFEPHVRLLRKENGGQASAFNAGIPECRGEIIAFLDGDDWWECNKAAVVVEEFQNHPEIGTIGHGIFETNESGLQLVRNVPDKSYTSRLSSTEEGKEFLPLRAFLGTSRLAVRRSVLKVIIPVPVELTVEADEFLATEATALAGARVITKALTNYRLHSGNLFQFVGADEVKVRRKYKALATIVRELPERLKRAGVADEVTQILTNAVLVDAGRLRLSMGEGRSWETYRVERQAARLAYRDSDLGYRAFHTLVLGIAMMLPPKMFYEMRTWYANRRLARFRKSLGQPAPADTITQRTLIS